MDNHTMVMGASLFIIKIFFFDKNVKFPKVLNFFADKAQAKSNSAFWT
jgi:hypothetical protein